MSRFFFPPGGSLNYLGIIYVIFRIGPGVGVGVGAGVGVDQETGVGAGVGVRVGKALPRLRTPGEHETRNLWQGPFSALWSEVSGRTS